MGGGGRGVADGAWWTGGGRSRTLIVVAAISSRAITHARTPVVTFLQRVGLSALGASLVLQLVGSAVSGQRLGLTVGWVGLSALGGALAAFVAGRRARRGEVTVDERAVCVAREGEGETRLERAAIDEAYVEVDERGGARAVLVSASRRFEIGLPSVEEAERLLQLARLDARSRAVRFAIRESGSAVMSGFLTVVFMIVVGERIFSLHLLDGDLPRPAGALFVVSLGALAIAFGHRLGEAVQPSPVHVGADGIRWVGWFNRRHWVRYADLQHVELEGRKLRLRARRGSFTVDFSIELGDTPAAVRGALVRRIEAAWLAEVPHAPLELLAREGRDLDAWRARLAALVSEGQESYRQAKIPRVRVEAALEDPDAPPDQRLGAAIALTSSGSAEQRERARRRAAELARSVADPALAEAFVEISADRLAPRVVERVGDAGR